MNLKELKARAAELEIRGRSKMNKAQLEEALATYEATKAARIDTAVEAYKQKRALTEEKAKDALARVLAISMAPENPGWTLITGEAERKKSKRTKQRRRARINKRGY